MSVLLFILDLRGNFFVEMGRRRSEKTPKRFPEVGGIKSQLEEKVYPLNSRPTYRSERRI